MDMASALKASIEWLCTPRKRFTQNELKVLGAVYDDAPVPPLAFATFRNEADSELHVQELLLVMQGHPAWQLDPVARDILNGAHQPTRWFGYKVYALAAYGTSCVCCLGWRIAVWTGVMFAAGVLVGERL